MPIGKPSARPSKLSHADVVAILKEGGSVIHNGEIIDSMAALPTEAEFAAGDAAMLQDSMQALEAEEASIQARKAAIARRQAEAAAAKQAEVKPGDTKSADTAKHGDQGKVTPNAK